MHDFEGVLNIKNEDRFIYLAKEVGLSIKQIAPHLGRSMSWIEKKWWSLPATESSREPLVSKKHKEIILVLLLANVDLISLSAIFGYAPKVILRFVESTCKEEVIDCRPCKICGNYFLDINNKLRCQSPKCKKEYRRQYKNKHKKNRGPN